MQASQTKKPSRGSNLGRRRHSKGDMRWLEIPQVLLNTDLDAMLTIPAVVFLGWSTLSINAGRRWQRCLYCLCPQSDAWFFRLFTTNGPLTRIGHGV